ncbi:MAG: bifunctional serine/threonine-protein kinase/formylglycine-generating enzyme family protein [Geminocystis sp.]|nr:bifunctional serine/threonine-protein kinase/formylglycine-generating enzyme family protein [Geminocystis sp.]MDW8116710.1 bifunctional serine/threonine-protein kinase/formylglycine-generating enzyme family protein [Geminocystis sp.]
MSSWKKGKTLNNGQFVIESILRGGVGVFYRARETSRNKLVTIVATEIADLMGAEKGDLTKKLIQQARQVANNCQNPYIVKLYPQVFVEEDIVYMVMEYPQGVDLATYLDNQGKFSPSEALILTRKIATALNLLHQNRCLHLNIKPQNIILEQETKEPIIIDYGWAIKLFVFAQRRKTYQGLDCFSPPERWQENGKLGVYSDVYSLAATLYVLVTAQLPTSANLRNLQPLIPPKHYNPNLSDTFNDAILKGMAMDVKQRPHCLRDWLELFKDSPEMMAASPTVDLPSTPTLTQEEEEITEKNEETVVQPADLTAPLPTLTRPRYNYPNIEKFTFETISLSLKKTFLGLVSKVEKKLTTREAQFFVEYLGEGVNLEMIFIPGGKFLMGSNNDEEGRDNDEGPQHLVSLGPFYISKYPITQLQWRVVSRFPKIVRPLKPKPAAFKGDNLPVERVSWFDAQEFCKRLSKYTGRNYRLPTEAEWEYACRGNTQTRYSFGDVITPEVANYNPQKQGGKNTSLRERKTTPVDNFYPNPFGLYDCHGNVWEWCEDHYTSSYTSTPRDGSPHYSTMSNQNRVVRGGSFALPARYCRSAKRNSYPPEACYNFIGFRVVCVLE